MAGLSEHIQKADWKKEKHVPVIDCAHEVRAGELFEVRVAVGKEMDHPNTTEHHIRWISLYYHVEGGKFICEVGRVNFSAHGESARGPDKGDVYTHHEAVFKLKVMESGTLHAASYCNIHGLWESSKALKVTPGIGGESTSRVYSG